jgi:hypothetical protein
MVIRFLMDLVLYLFLFLIQWKQVLDVTRVERF